MSAVALLVLPVGFMIYYSKQIATALERLGIDCKIYYLGEGREREYIDEWFEDPPQAFFGVATIDADPIFLGFGYDPEMILICDSLQVPYFCYQIDPVLQIEHVTKSPYATLLHVDEMYAHAMKSVVARSYFMPFGVDPHLRGEREKIYDAVFFGSCFDPDSLIAVWQERFSLPVQKQLHDAVEMCLDQPDLNSLELVQELRLAFHVECYLRAKERIELVKQLDNCRVHVFGPPGPITGIGGARGWTDVLKGCDHVVCHPPVSYEKSLDIMKRSRIVLNSSPHFRRGFHDRVLNGMACQAAVVTNNHAFVKEQFPGIITYRHGHWDELRENVQNMRADDMHDEVIRNHSWTKRMEAFLAYLPH